jgi:Uma2 family endonuclease
MAGDRAKSFERNAPEIEAAFEAAPSTLIAQIIHGSLHLSPRPARAHTHVASNLGILLGGPFRFGTNGPGGWVILDEPELHLGAAPDKLVPDIAGWRRARMPTSTAAVAVEPAFFDVPPDWVCEVLSPGTEVIDRGEKLPIYAREGVGSAWLLDPAECVLEAYRLERGTMRRTAVHAGAVKVRIEPFDAIEIDLALVWSR